MNTLKKKFFCGVDIGSLTTKVVLLDAKGEMVSRAWARSGYAGKEVAHRLLSGMLEKVGARQEEVTVVATGYGRVTYPADREFSEISCQARAIARLFPAARTVIDIGGQDSKVIRISPQGRVLDFAMNDKCAAGTGRFLEVMAQALEVPVEELGHLAEKSSRPLCISSTCTVFAESEVVSCIARGEPKEDIVAGICAAVAARVLALAERVGLEPEVVFTGGVARNKGVVKAMRERYARALAIPPEPEITAALGAALLAMDLGTERK